MVQLIIGIIIGMVFGVFSTALAVAASRADRMEDDTVDS